MKSKLTIQEAGDLAAKLMSEGNHCGPTTVRVLHEAWGMEDDAMLKAATNFYGGIAGHQEGPCGAISGLTLALGFLYGNPSADEETAKAAAEKAGEVTKRIAQQFKDEYGSLVCIDLVGVDFSDPAAVEKHMSDPEKRDICPGYVRYIVEKILEIEE